MNQRPTAGRAVSGNAPNPYPRSSSQRSHAHSLSTGSLNSTNRIDRRRKSTSANNAAAAAVALGLVAEKSGEGTAASLKFVRRGGSKTVTPYATSLPASTGFGQNTFEASPSSAIIESPTLEALSEAGSEVQGRARRASDGSRLIKSFEGKRQVNGELKCETCGKGYKHSSCLHKHLWEHTPEWAITSKLLISKHQQVQLLEAASVLVQMNQNAIDSDVSSPAASSSDLHSDVVSSKAGSPPPVGDHMGGITAERSECKRFSGNSSTYSHSYQSSVLSDARHYNVHTRQISNDNRPTTSGTSATSYTDEDREDNMSNAFNLLSCGYGNTPKTGPRLDFSIPPVPPLPAKYLGRSLDHLSGTTITGVPHAQSSYLRESRLEDINMVEEEEKKEEEEEEEHGPRQVHGRSDDEEEGMFGTMEE